jgi:hypothetical protein
MERPARTRLIAVLVLLAVSVPLVVLLAVGGGGDEDEGEEPKPALRVERSPEFSEMLIYIDDASANRSERAAGRARVTIECVDSDGVVLASQEEPWPMTETDGNTLAPHAHLPVNPARIGDVVSCRIKGTDPLLEGQAL